MPDRNREAWNDEDYATLRRMAAAGVKVGAIARELGRTRQAVSRKANSLGMKVRDITKRQRPPHSQ
jgi:hypothetical protein